MVSRKRAKGKARKAAVKTSNSGVELATESTLSNQVGAELNDGLDFPDMPAELREGLLDIRRSTNKAINAMKDLRASGGSDGDIISRLSLNEPEDSDKKKSEAEIAFENVLMKLKLSEVVGGPPTTFDDCDICMERMPPRTIQSSYLPCCGKVICRSCWVRGTSPFIGKCLEWSPQAHQ